MPENQQSENLPEPNNIINNPASNPFAISMARATNAETNDIRRSHYQQAQGNLMDQSFDSLNRNANDKLNMSQVQESQGRSSNILNMNNQPEKIVTHDGRTSLEGGFQ